jgi:L-fuconolactonase
MRVDAHQHFWRLDDPQRDWPPPALAALYRDFTPGELAPLLEAHGIERSVLVQSLPCEADTLALLDLAAGNAFIGAVVGWTDLKAPDAPQRIAQLSARPKMRGLRPMLQDMADGAWLDDPALEPAVRAMVASGLCFDALVRPRHLPALLRFAVRFPELSVVIDHAAKPDLAARCVDTWRTDMRRLARLPNVVCKLSGLVTEAAPGWQPGDLQPCVAELLDCFGPHRLLWGSDWPVLNLAADYGAWLAACDALLADLDHDARAAVLGLNACRIYRLKGNHETAAIRPEGQ